MKIVHLIQGMERAAGTTVFVENLIRGLNPLGHIASVLTSQQPLDLVRAADIVHVHGLWSPMLHNGVRLAERNQIPIVWSPHGMMTPWAMRNKWWKKWPAWYLYQKKDLASAALLHATAQSEVDDIRRMKLTNPVVVAPLGVDIVKVEKEARPYRTLLFVSRVQRKKGLENALRAWAKAGLKGWRFRIVGPDQENHTAELKMLASALGVIDSVDFVGPKYGDELTREYASADIFVLPTHSENFGSVVIESLAQGVPVICTKGAPWGELETHKCGWWIDIGVDSLVDALCAAADLRREEIARMGDNGRALVASKYTWKAVCDKMIDGYEEVLNGRA